MRRIRLKFYANLFYKNVEEFQTVLLVERTVKTIKLFVSIKN